MAKRKSIKKRIGLGLVGALGIGMLLVTSSCAVQLGLKKADTGLTGPPIATPSILSAIGNANAISSEDAWPERRDLLKKMLAENVYGPYPSGLKGRVLNHRVVNDNYANGAGRLEEFHIQVGEKGPKFYVGLVLPTSANLEKPAPLIIAQSFCQNSAALKDDGLTDPVNGGVCGAGGIMGSVIRGIFGKYVEGPPIEQVLAHGYAYATVYSSEIAADNSEKAQIGIDQVAAETTPENTPVGVLSVWAAGFGWVIDVLGEDKRLDAERTIGWGHSRQGKAVLWAAAHDDRLEAVIAHQSGTGGATLSRSLNGESVKKITAEYPHWFNETFASYADREDAIPLDQHFLIALAAPRPVFLGNSWNDVWSDPNGAFRAAQGADEAYRLLGAKGLVQTGLNDTDITSGKLAFQISKGRHGIRQEDWDDFLEFLDAHFLPSEI